MILLGGIHVLFLIAACLFFYTLTESVIPLYFLLAVMIFFISVPFIRWRNHFKNERVYANKFADLLETKNSELETVLTQLKEIKTVTESPWMDFTLDLSTFRIQLENLIGDEIKEINKLLNDLLTVDSSCITNLKKQGNDGDDKLKLSIGLTLIWFSHNWIEQELDQIVSKATIKINEGTEFFNLRTNNWEDEQGKIITEPTMRYDKWLF